MAGYGVETLGTNGMPRQAQHGLMYKERESREIHPPHPSHSPWTLQPAFGTSVQSSPTPAIRRYSRADGSGLSPDQATARCLASNQKSVSARLLCSVCRTLWIQQIQCGPVG